MQLRSNQKMPANGALRHLRNLDHAASDPKPQSPCPDFGPVEMLGGLHIPFSLIRRLAA